MDSKEMKASLRAAREAIRNKDYKEAIKHCKSILKHDKSNYNALVFVGVAAEGLEQAEQALMAYKKATEAEPQQILAWQGLCGFYEKSGKVEYREDLAEVYEQLLILCDSDLTKKQEIGLKLGQLHHSLGNEDKALEVYERTSQWSSNDRERLAEVSTRVLQILQNKTHMEPRQIIQLRTAYEILIKTCETDDEEIWRKYIASLLKDSEISAEYVVRECEVMRQKFPSSVTPLETICRIYINAVASREEPGLDIGQTESDLMNVNPDSHLLLLIKGIHELLLANYKTAATYLTEGVQEEKSASGWTLLSEARLGLHSNTEAEKSARKGLKLLDGAIMTTGGSAEKMKVRLQTLLCKALTDQATATSLQQAIQLAKELLEGDGPGVDARSYLTAAYIQQNELCAAKQALDELSGSGGVGEGHGHLEGWYYFLAGDMDTAHKVLSEAVVAHPGAALCWYWLARVHYHSNNFDEAFPAYLKAAKLDPFYSDTFLYLGHYYQQVLKDTGKARRCYQKAYELDTSQEAAGAALVDTLIILGEEEAASQILLSVTSNASAGSGKWAWLRLGLQQLRIGDPSAAIASLQAALRADPKDVHVWECVGEAYRKRGSYTAALKAFTKATQLDAGAMYCFYQIANIKQTLGMDAEAVTEYETILCQSPDYVPALKGVGETLLSLAKAAVAHHLYGKAATYCEKAVLHLTRGAMSRADLACLWKLLGDCCTILHSAPLHLMQLNVPGKLLNVSNDLNVNKLVKGQQLLALGGRCYGMALRQQAQCAPLWHDLGLNYFYQAEISDSNSGPLASKAMQALQKAVSLHPESHTHWTALGVVAAGKDMDHPALAQHCFIKSIQAEPNNVEAWTNLGTLYLRKENVELAHEAFKTAQSLDPAYVASWIGQALIAEMVGHHDTMDLFRHTTLLGLHPEGSIGYAHWVCSTLLDESKQDHALFKYSIEQMSAIPAASDSLSKYLDQIQTNAAAYNMYGLLLERQGLHRQAVQALAKCVELLDKGPRDQLDKCKANYARILSQAGDYEGSIKQFEDLEGSLSTEDTWWQALSLYKAGRLQESLQVYEGSVGRCPTEADVSHVHAACGMVAYKMNDIEGAKAAFFQGFQQREPSVWGLDALCSVGLLQQDFTLVGAVLQELAKLPPDSKRSHHAELLSALCCALQGDIEGGRRGIAKAIHRHPEQANLWNNLSTYLLSLLPGQHSKPATTCAMAARKLDHNVSQDIDLAICLGSVASGYHSQRDPTYNCLQLAQKAVHQHPETLSAWCGLISAMYADSMVQPDSAKIHQGALSLATHLMSQVEGELQGYHGDTTMLQALHLWSVKQYVLLLLSLGRLDQASQFIQQAVWLYDGDIVLKGLNEMLTQNYKGMKKLAKQYKDPFLWQLLFQALLAEGLVKEVEKCLVSLTSESILETESSENSNKTACLVQLCHLAYKQIMIGGEDDKWKNIFKENSSEAFCTELGGATVHMMQAMLLLEENNKRVAKHHLERVLEADHTGSVGKSVTVARQHLLVILLGKQDQAGTEKLLSDAVDQNDGEFIKFYESITK